MISTLDNLVPGFTPTADAAAEPFAAREVKGSIEMVTILKRTVQRYQLVPDEPEQIDVDGVTIEATPAMIKAARTRARRSRQPHNRAQLVFAEHLTQSLAAALAQRIGEDPLGGANLLSAADVDQLHDDLADHPQVRDLIDHCFPVLSPRQVLDALLTSREQISQVAGDYDDYTQNALFREPGSAHVPSDTALIDELATLLGLTDPEEVREREEAEWRRQVEEAEDALDILASSEATDNDDDQFEAEILSAADVIDAETLASRQQVRDIRSTAQRAAEDQTWAFGHVIVDEAQELSPMEWRMVFRRCPSKWMTLVGDTAQTSAPAGTDDWAAALEPFVGERYRLHRLTVNYRTPTEIMSYAEDVLRKIGADQAAPTSIRSTGIPVTCLPAGTDPAVARAQLDERSCVIITAENAAQVKGLEFDHVIVVDPRKIVEASPQGWQDLYVAVTRATQSLTVFGDPIP